MSAGEGDSLKAVIVAVAVNSVITVAKYVGWFMTGSPALLAEGIHSTADVGNQVLLWIGIRSSRKEATEEHPYGYGPARYLWNLKSAMGIFFLGCGVTLYHGGHSLYQAWHGNAHADGSGWVGIGILVAAFVLETYSLVVALQEVNKGRGDMSWREYMAKGDDPTGVGVVLEDGAAVLGVLIALVGVGLSKALHTPYPDAIATLVIGGLLGWLAIFLAKANGRLLIGASVSPLLEGRIREALLADEMVERVEDLKTSVLGQGRIRVKCEIDLYEALLAKRMREDLREDVRQLEAGEEEPMKILVEAVGRSVRIAGRELKRLETVVRGVAPTAVHIDLELL